VVATTRLTHGLDRDIVRGKGVGYLREHTRLVGDVEADVIARDRLAHRAYLEVGVGRFARAERAPHLVAGDRDDVAEHGARCRRATGATTVEHQLARRFTLDEHGVVRLAHRGQGVRS